MHQVNSLFTKPSNTINFKDIEDFCSLKLTECETIDYKKDLSSIDKIIKTIAAMANTDGGLILIGVPENEGPNGRKSVPGKPHGLHVKRNYSVIQQIANSCQAHLQPQYCPEVIEIPTNDSEKIVVLIRIIKDAVPETPVFHREHGICIRVLEEDRPADVARIKRMIEDNDNKYTSSSTPWFFGKMPNLSGFLWCTIGVKLPMKRFRGHLKWNSAQVDSFKKAVLQHKIDPKLVWVHRYNSLFGKSSPLKPEVRLRRTSKDINFNPYPQPKPGEDWFSLWFGVDGFLSGSIGFHLSENRNVLIEQIICAFYAILDLFNQDQIRANYIDALWDIGRFEVIYQVANIPGSIESCFRWLPPDEFVTPGSTIGGSAEIVESLNPETLSKHFTDLLLSDLGFLSYETDLKQLNIERMLAQM